MLLVYAEMSDGQNVLIYCNNAKNSWRSFRPLRLKFLKETTATNLQEGEKLVGEMDKLAEKPYLPPAFPKVEVHFHGYLTMIDGKVTMKLNLYICKQTARKCLSTYLFCLKHILNESLGMTKMSPKNS